MEIQISSIRSYKPVNVDDCILLIVQAILRCIREYDRIRFFDTKKREILFNHNIIEKYDEEYQRKNIVPLEISQWIINKKIDLQENNYHHKKTFYLGVGKIVIALPLILSFDMYLFWSCFNEQKKEYTIKDIQDCLRIEIEDHWIGSI